MINQELLIDHLDKTIQGESLPEAAALIAGDSNARTEWQYLQTAVEAVQHAALYERVGAIHAAMQSAPVIPLKQTPVRSMAKRVMRIAAAAILLVGAVAVYKFATVSSDNFYNKHYTAYELSTTRGGIAITQLEEAYRNNNWEAVENLYNVAAVKTNKEHFLAGMASMERRQYSQAIERFNLVRTTNANTSDNYFQDEAEYYLALAYIPNGEAEQASDLLKQIAAEKGHLYQQKAADMLGLDLKILELK